MAKIYVNYAEHCRFHGMNISLQKYEGLYVFHGSNLQSALQTLYMVSTKVHVVVVLMYYA